MDPYLLSFNGMSTIVVFFYLAMIFLPYWQVTQRVIRSFWTPALFALPYALLEIPHYIPEVLILARPTYEHIHALLGTEPGTTQGWIHFIALDFFAARWVFLDSRERNTSPFVMAPIMFCMVIFGPLGVVLYLSLRALQDRKAAAASASAVS